MFISVTTTSLTAGTSFAWTSAVIPKFYNNETSFHLTEAELSWMVSSASIGYVIGSLVSRLISDRFGRRASLLASSFPISISLILYLVAWEVWTVCAARMLLGCGSSLMGAVSPIYLAEISDKELRGSLILACRAVFSFGCLLVMAIGPFVSYQTLNYSLLILPVSIFASCWWIPESPYFLLKMGKVEAARDILMKLTATNKDVLENKLTQMRADVRSEMSRSGTYKEFFTGKKYRRAIVIVVGVKSAQVLSGLHTIQHYLGPIIQESKNTLSTKTALIILGVVRFLLGITSSLLVDRVGRRPLIIYSYFGTGMCLAAVGVYFFFNVHPSPENPYGLIPFVGIILAIVIAMLGFESVSYSIPAELFPLNIKSNAMTSMHIFCGSLNFFSVKSYQPAKDLAGLSTVFGFYAVVTLAGAVFSQFFLPETKCKSLKQIQMELQGSLYDEDSDKLRSALNNNEKSDENTDAETESKAIKWKNVV